MKLRIILSAIMMSSLLLSCKQHSTEHAAKPKDDFVYLVEQFADLKIMRYQVPGFEDLTLRQKELIYYLSQAALCGRDIIFDQNYKYNLAIRRTLEGVVDSYKGDRKSADFAKFMVYTKRVWFSNGIHHHYGSEKFLPECSKEYFAELVRNSDPVKLPVRKGKSVEDLITELTPIIFDPVIAPKKVSLDANKDLVLNSAVNFYSGVTEAEAEAYYTKMQQPNPAEPLSLGLNSKLVKENGKLIEETYKVGGLYTQAIEQIVFWLKKAVTVAENDAQKAVLEKLISYYETGSLKTWDDYNVIWVGDLKSNIDVVNGFIENYEDPLGRKATWESMVNFKDEEGTKRTTIISNNAQWFEDNSPIDPRFRKAQVKGVTAKVITAAQLAGDCYPSTPIGINLPNADWIRKEHGSKSVTIENITYAYDQAALGNGVLERELSRKYGSLAGNLHTDLHECLGHGSGQLLPGTSSEALKNYSSTLEEARADLFALYYLMDPKMVELGLIPTLDVAKAEYNSYIRNGLMVQLTRIEPGKSIEEAHMRNRQLIAKWCMEKGAGDKVIEKVTKEGKTYFTINNYDKLRKLFGELLAEIQRIKSEGDFAAGKALVESYGVIVDETLKKEVRERYAKLNVAPYGGFMNPVFTPVKDGDKITDIKIEYPQDYTGQMMNYSRNYSFLPTYN